MKNIPWDADDVAYIRNIFTQPSGRRFLEKMRQGVPRVTATKLEEVSVEALKKQGAEDLLDYIESLVEMPEPLQEGRDFIDLTKEGD